jgi:hypothetical protein
VLNTMHQVTRCRTNSGAAGTISPPERRT